jgi:hypothetical protein
MTDRDDQTDPGIVRALWLAGHARKRLREHERAGPRMRPLRLVELFPRDAQSRPLLLMSYAIGDHVVPTDLPRPFICCVTYARPVGDTPLQVLELAPLEGPWPPDTLLIRGGDVVRPAAPSELAQLRRLRARRARPGQSPPRRRRQSIRIPDDG